MSLYLVSNTLKVNPMNIQLSAALFQFELGTVTKRHYRVLSRRILPHII